MMIEFVFSVFIFAALLLEIILSYPRLYGYSPIFWFGLICIQIPRLGIKRQRDLERFLILSRKPQSDDRSMIYRNGVLIMTSRLRKCCYSEEVLLLHYISATCPNTWVQLRDSCYRFSSNKLVWSEAKSTCEAQGSKLAVVNSPAEQNLLASSVAERTWIGLHRDPNDTSRWLWIDGSNVTYTSWRNKQPDNYLGTGNCAEINPSLEAGKWNDRNCTHHVHYVCEISGK